ncbi:helix-turn-helix transcriptional regulator [Amycolatopsis sp. 195334CR]|uniref:helix-turn-helix domain-containing protein n=1 Tax=Amycolatopsis sp. 195334CR TaxID=2814588 RepID=UPI001A8EAB22|nr:helix-turn-helix transcriptional regulator [Amycolatopsis sp. 195334CR]MBN6036543.1 helix-turn-helix transcriptional regulator [Amycolatopsis sp. 195334CR]
MAEGRRLFGTELRRRRNEAGLSLTQLAAKVHYSKGYLSKIETNRKPPPPELARLCDVALAAKGALTALVPAHLTGAPLPETQDDSEVWIMNLSADGSSWFRPMGRREAMAMGVGSAIGFGLGTAGLGATSGETTALAALHAHFDQFRRLGQTASPGVVLPALVAQTHTIQQLAGRATEHHRNDLLLLGARYAEYAGWMAQESGDDKAALWWTDRAVEMAEAGGDHDLAAYSLVRRALVTLYRDDARQTIELAQHAQSFPVPARIRGLAAQREAQGHALAGDRDACLRSLDEAQELLGRADAAPGPVLGTTNLPNPAKMVLGWCMFDMGRAREAAEVLDREVDLIPAEALRTRARYGIRRALAHATANEVDHACALTHELIGLIDVVSSATITLDVQRLRRTLARFRSQPAVREVSPLLDAALHAPTA